MPRKTGSLAYPVCLVLMALPLLIPWNVVGAMWNIFGRCRRSACWAVYDRMGSVFDYNYHPTAGIDAWLTLTVAMDVWHWTIAGGTALLMPGWCSIPGCFLPGCKDRWRQSRWAVFRYIQLPKTQAGSDLIAVLLRFMDSFMIYTEPFVITGGGPGNATTFLSIDLVKTAIGQFDLGPAAALSLIYFLIILLLSWIFYTVMTNSDAQS